LLIQRQTDRAGVDRGQPAAVWYDGGIPVPFPFILDRSTHPVSENHLPELNLGSTVRTVSSQGVPVCSWQVSQIEVSFTQARIPTSQISPGLRGLPSTPAPGSGSGEITASAISLISDAERYPPGSGMLNTSRTRHFFPVTPAD
jgi:hypothetical protein